MEKFKSVALLVDGDNIPVKFADEIRTKAAGLGDIKTSRVYALAPKIECWSKAIAFSPITVKKGKDSADFALSFDALILALEGDHDAFVIASSDNHFFHIATRLKEMKLPVLGLGGSQPSQRFKSACRDFDRLGSEDTTKKTIGLVRAVFAKKETASPGILHNEINSLVRKQDPTFEIGATDFKGWPKFFRKHQDQFTVTGKGSKKTVRQNQ